MTTVELHVWRVEHVGRALARMAGGRRSLRRTPGLRFAKLLGTGAGRTFTPGDADPRHWALLSVWDDAPRPLPVVARWDAAAAERLVVRMTPLATRGRWSRREPFGDVRPEAARGWDGPVAALTRARLRPSRALSFWRAVPSVVGDLHGTPGLRLALGVGEAPVALQGTFSLWDSAAALKDFAYRSPAHVRAVERTEPARWYAEELFARLAVHDVEGTHLGRTP
jgi:hypothetical protein